MKIDYPGLPGWSNGTWKKGRVRDDVKTKPVFEVILCDEDFTCHCCFWKWKEVISQTMWTVLESKVHTACHSV